MKKVALILGLILLFGSMLLIFLLPEPEQAVVDGSGEEVPGFPLGGDRELTGDESGSGPLVSGTGSTGGSTDESPLPPKRYLSDEQHAAVKEQGEYLGDEAAYDIHNDQRMHIWFSGRNDDFHVDLLGTDLTFADREHADQILATLLGVPVAELCEFTVVVRAPNTPFEIDSAITKNCPER